MEFQSVGRPCDCWPELFQGDDGNYYQIAANLRPPEYANVVRIDWRKLARVENCGACWRTKKPVSRKPAPIEPGTARPAVIPASVIDSLLENFAGQIPKETARQILSRYDGKASALKVGQACGVSSRTVALWWAKAGVDTQESSLQRSRRMRPLIAAAYDGTQSQRQLTKQFGAGAGCVREAIKALTPAPSSRVVFESRSRFAENKPKIIQLLQKGESPYAIAKFLGTDCKAIRRLKVKLAS